MSYETERIAITNKIQSDNFYGIPQARFALEGEGANVSTPNSGFMIILSGQANQISVGSPGSNLHDYVGVLSITVITEGGKGSSEGKAIADQIINAFTGLKIDENGNIPSNASAMTIDFARNGLAPYISDARAESPNYRTVVNAPFVRIERK